MSIKPNQIHHTMLQTIKQYDADMKPKLPFRVIRFSLLHVFSSDLLYQPFRPTVCSKYNLKMFSIGQPLGEGRFGTVYLAKYKLNNYVCAIKVLHKRKIERYNMTIQLKREVELMSHFNHHNVVKLFAFFDDETRYFLVMEFCKGGELYKLLQKQIRFSEPEAAKYVKQTTDALIHIHQRKCIHRDLKPENILLDMNGDVKLSDFGWSVRSDCKRKTCCGTPDYLSPELIENKTYDKAVDLWSLGVLTFELLTGYTPFGSIDFVNKQQVNPMLISFPVYVSYIAKDFIRKLIVKEPSMRMSLENCLKHAFLVKNVK
ncbi:hypothetical protein EIN_155420 [Entamoeba invadens IP1]|uniref:Aurora kinase n=1 Tax=Entamoeba invadens IP1 TaxID=370355 RepID=A0A0A1U931_ENTIV|nr:hypothetical protein EIN_155420 [Entamoeba invadens IP1]ELP91435.1 hypothetical protein EIN_155420 [Entamoeba invadens IP1]|eukprot:XP_004258206.1 hypothetical protein EIN_155420 [Entamoeba invadens IP1]